MISAKLKDPSTPLKKVEDVVTKGAKSAEPMKEIVGKSAIPSGEGTTDSRSAGSKAESVPASVVPGQKKTTKEEAEVEEDIISEERDRSS